MSNRNMGTMKTCSHCEKPRVPEGGVELSPTRWVCAKCWSDAVRKGVRK